MAITLGSGRPFKGAIINTKPKQLRFVWKADQNYTIRVAYVPYPPDLTALTDTLYVQDDFTEGVFLKFKIKVAEEFGRDDVAEIYKMKYRQWLNDNIHIARSINRKFSRIKFKWL